MSFGNEFDSNTLTQPHTHVHKTMKYTNIHTHSYKNYYAIRTTHIHVKFMLQIKTNRHACAPSLVFALVRHRHFISEFHTICFHPIVCSTYTHTHTYIHAYTQITNYYYYHILYSSTKVLSSTKFSAPSPLKVHVITHRCAACYCSGIFVRLSSIMHR